MGKNLKGQEIGKGISQRPDKTYRARYVNSLGKRVEEHFFNLKDAQAWLTAERAVKTCLSKSKSPDIKVDEFFNLWIRILCLLTTAQGCPTRTVLMIPISTSFATGQGSSTFVCTYFVIHTQREPLRLEYNQSIYKSYSVIPASKLPWIDMYTCLLLL